ncbi:MOSC domain-containing protein [Serinicoccus chungangensis]|uniref:MOSC domain-containing protein n=1 Tax=Serinicoccus chungangensis TaxID=767452 RepID=UPI001119939F|nr:MOSC domain-containing protein [Serinicoccus chungangensis]
MSQPQDPVRVVEIGIAPGSRLPVKRVHEVEAEAGVGLVGDRYHGSRHRHVTLQSRTDLDAAAADLGRPVTAAGTRRNLTVSHGPVPTRPGTLLRVGEVELQVVRLAAPCRLLDDWLGPGAMAALHGRGGTVCRLLGSGTIRVGDELWVGEVAPAPVRGDAPQGPGRTRPGDR